MSINEQPLLFLLNAKGKETVNDIFVTAFRFRRDTIPERKLAEWSTELEVSVADAAVLAGSVQALVRSCLYSSSLPSQVLSEGFHPQLAALMNKVLKAHAEEWRMAVTMNKVSPPQLLEFNYRIDTKASSDALAKMSSSSLLLALKIQDQPTQVGVMPGVKDVQLELSTQELATMLDGLGKIKDQLESIK